MRYSDEELLDEIRAVAAQTDGDTAPSLQDFRQHSSIADTTVLRRFDSWQAAVEKAGFEPHDPTTSVPDTDLLAELHRLADEVGRIPTIPQMNERGEYAASTYQNHFGSWSAALDEAFDDTSEAGARVSNNELLKELQRIGEEYRSPPRFEDMRRHGSHRARTYTHRFGSWDDALTAAGFEPRGSHKIPTADLVADLQRLRDELGEPPSSTDVVEQGEYGLATYQRRFGSWAETVATVFADEQE